MQWDGYVTKSFDEYSEHIVEGTEKELKAMSGVKPLYRLDGTFTGRESGLTFPYPAQSCPCTMPWKLKKQGNMSIRG